MHLRRADIATEGKPIAAGSFKKVYKGIPARPRAVRCLKDCHGCCVGNEKGRLRYGGGHVPKAGQASKARLFLWTVRRWGRSAHGD